MKNNDNSRKGNINSDSQPHVGAGRNEGQGVVGGESNPFSGNETSPLNNSNDQTSAYDNYNHYEGSSTPLISGSTFYGPNGQKLTVNTNGTNTLTVTDSDGSTTIYRGTPNKNGAVTSYVGPNGSNAGITTIDGNQQVIYVEDQDGNRHLFYQTPPSSSGSSGSSETSEYTSPNTSSSMPNNVYPNNYYGTSGYNTTNYSAQQSTNINSAEQSTNINYTKNKYKAKTYVNAPSKVNSYVNAPANIDVNNPPGYNPVGTQVGIDNYPGYNPPGYNPPGSAGINNPPGYNPPGYNPPGYNPVGTQVGIDNYPGYYNPPGYNPPGSVGINNPPGYNPPGYNPVGTEVGLDNPPGYNPPGYNPPGSLGINNPPGYNPPGYNPPGVGYDYSSLLPPGIPYSQIPSGQEDLYIKKSEVIPPVCPACPVQIKEKTCAPCPACERCPEPAYDCKLVPNYSSSQTNAPVPVLNDFSSFGM